MNYYYFVCSSDLKTMKYFYIKRFSVSVMKNISAVVKLISNIQQICRISDSTFRQSGIWQILGWCECKSTGRLKCSKRGMVLLKEPLNLVTKTQVMKEG